LIQMESAKPDQSQPAPDPEREAQRAAAGRIDRVNDWLHVGGALPPDEYVRFRTAGITHIVDLREETLADARMLGELGIVCRHVPVPDRGPPSTQQLVAVAQWLDEQDPDARMYVHCKGGFGRAATMAVGLLVLRGSALDDAVEQVRQARPEMRLNPAQLEWLQTVERERRNDRADK
jgi:protein-tyrosine phosphatase